MLIGGSGGCTIPNYQLSGSIGTQDIAGKHIGKYCLHNHHFFTLLLAHTLLNTEWPKPAPTQHKEGDDIDQDYNVWSVLNVQ